MGPTGVGKTAVAVRLAEMLGTRIVSCDSMQVYRGFPILTNQPSAACDKPEFHELVGVVEPSATISAGEYARMAAPLVEGDLGRCGWALVCGGSGLYMRAALAPLAVEGVGDPGLRLRLEERARLEGVGALHQELTRLDPEAGATVDPHNVRRVVRALESVLSGGRWSGRTDLWRPDYYHPTLVVGLSMERAALTERIYKRTAWMLEAGACEEVRSFRAAHGLDSTRPGLPGICSAIGYREICEYLDGCHSAEEAVRRIATATAQYARRQMTWLRKVKGAVMIDAQGRDTGGIAAQILELAEA